MHRYIARRTGGLALVVAVTLVLTFLAIRAVPGDPVLMMLGDQTGNEELARALRHQYGLDRSMGVQFLTYILRLLHGDLGLSYRFQDTPVIEVIREALKISPLLALGALTIAVPAGLALGILAALRRGTLVDTGIMLAVTSCLSIPSFALAAFLVWLFSVKLGWLPVAGWRTPAHAVLPIVLLAIGPTAAIARLSRTFMIDVLGQDYMRTARAKGLSEHVVILRHGLRNALVPILTVIGVILGFLATGTFIIETLFNIPGLGRLAVESILARDYPVTMAIVLLFTLTFALINFAVDLLYAVIDPRIRLEEGK